MSDWSVIVPDGSTNYVTNPSFELDTTGWANYATGAAGGTRARSAGQHKFGLYAYRFTKNAGAQADRYGASDSLDTSILSQAYVASAYVRIDGGTAAIYLEKGGASPQNVTATTTTTNEWVRLETSALTSSTAGDAMSVYVWITGTPTVVMDVDGVQVERLDHHTTYIDGTQEQCEWMGAEHASISQRSAQSRAGGRVYDLEDDFALDIGGVTGPGMPPISQILDEYALLPGGAVQGYKQHARTFVLSGLIRGTSQADLHAKRQSLIDILSPSSYPNNQPLTVRYTGASVDKECRCYYEGGLEYGVSASDDVCWGERVAFRFLQADPAWYEVGESAQELDNSDPDTFRYLAGRLRSTGQWDDLSLTNNPGLNGSIFTVCQASDGTVYFGGNFTNFNQTGTGIDYIVQYDPVTDTWARVGGANDVTGIVRAIVESPNGDIIIGGDFVAVDGDADADYMAVWDGSTWEPVGIPDAGAASITGVYSLDYDENGLLLIGGYFTRFADVANADGVATWNGTSYAALGAPGITVANSEYVWAIRHHPSGDVYIGGVFTAANGAPDDYAGRWSNAASSWGAVGPGGFSTTVRTIDVDARNFVYFGGNFVNLGDANGDYVVRFNGTGFESLGTGVNNAVYVIRFAPDGVMYIGGFLTAAGGLTVSYMARWNGSSWSHADVELMSGVTVDAIDFGPVSPTIPQNYSVWIGHDSTGTVYYAGLTTVSNDGTENAYPVIQVRRTGGNDGTLYQIRNETTGKELLFDYTIQDGEVLTIDLDPLNKSIVSSMFGDRMDAILRNCDFGDWALQPGDNEITCFVQGNVPATVDTILIWRDAYGSLD
jgi:hypothetical protein